MPEPELSTEFSPRQYSLEVPDAGLNRVKRWPSLVTQKTRPAIRPSGSVERLSSCQEPKDPSNIATETF